MTYDFSQYPAMLRAINDNIGHVSRLHAQLVRNAPKDRLDDYSAYTDSIHKGLHQLGAEYQKNGSVPSNLLNEVAGGVLNLSAEHRAYCGDGGENDATEGHVASLDKAAEGITHDNDVETPDFNMRWLAR
jgi:hypothetical protein